MGEDHGNCEELGATVKNPPAYGDRHGITDNAVNWGDPPLYGNTRKETFYKPKR
ncbi:hypothetical protein EFBL_3210 [Effusibacillus lacus]|uniref:Uncharacterized protein n=1 Tax=Effusibacillus lacus TaxID=1348429 RepID=A0A292YSR8_9BACL|nr:hypothetical protein EFBL_3210 [Effusibacillus lacus]